jgi:DNA-binding CsgD family transcriptional regulator
MVAVLMQDLKGFPMPPPALTEPSAHPDPALVESIVADIYHAAGGTKPWSAALNRANTALGLVGAHMVGVTASTGAVVFSHASDNIASDIELNYVRTYNDLDPRKAYLLASQPGDWFYDQDVFDDGMALSSPFYRDFLIPGGGRHSATVKLLDSEGEITLLGFVAGNDGLTASRRTMLRAITFHLREAAVIYQARRKLTRLAFAGAELLNRLTRPALLLSVGRNISHMNPAGRQYLGGGEALLLSNDRLIAFDPKSDDALSQAFQSMVEELPQGNAQLRRVVRLRTRTRPEPIAVSLTAFAPQASMYTFGMEPQVLLLVHDSTTAALPDLHLWEAVYDFTPAQSRVALEVYLGKSISQGAQALQIAQSTFKTHLRDVFNKTGMHGQTKLVSLLAGMQGI